MITPDATRGAGAVDLDSHGPGEWHNRRVARFIVVGLGNFGASVAVSLHEMGHEVAAVDLSPQRVEHVASLLSEVLAGDGTDLGLLDRLGARRADTAIVSTGSDVTASVLTAIALRDLGVTDIYVKVVSDLQARILGKVGVGDTIFPERESAQFLAHRVGNRAILSYVELQPGLAVQEMEVPRPWIGRSLRDLELPRRHGITVIAVRDRRDGALTQSPDPGRPLAAANTVLLAGENEALGRVARLG
jgi:trk/ktr system potassium uptake protein